jgi:hypothetical protein
MKVYIPVYPSMTEDRQIALFEKFKQKWNLKEPPVAIESCAVVIEPALFARTTLEQLSIALQNPKRWIGWSVSQLVERLAQVGVAVALENGNSSGSVSLSHGLS